MRPFENSRSSQILWASELLTITPPWAQRDESSTETLKAIQALGTQGGHLHGGLEQAGGCREAGAQDPG